MLYRDADVNPDLSESEIGRYLSLLRTLTKYSLGRVDLSLQLVEMDVDVQRRMERVSRFEEHLTSWVGALHPGSTNALEADLIRLECTRRGRFTIGRNLTYLALGIVFTAVVIPWPTLFSISGFSNFGIGTPVVIVPSVATFLFATLGVHLYGARKLGRLISGEFLNLKDAGFLKLLIKHGGSFKLGPLLKEGLTNSDGLRLGAASPDSNELVKSLARDWGLSFSELLAVSNSLSCV